MIQANEKFKVIEAFPDYEISNFGRVRTKARKIRFIHAVTGQEHFRELQSKFLKLNINGAGYYFTGLRKNSKGHSKVIHRLVAEAFLEKAEGKNVVNHIDGNKLNNCVANLEWCTDEYNHEHATKNGLVAKGSRVAASILNEKCAIAIKNLSAQGFSEKQIAEVFEISKTVVHYVKHNWKSAQPTTRQSRTIEKSMYLGIPIMQVDDSGELIKHYQSAYQAGIDLGLDPTLIMHVARGKFKQYKGHRFALTGTELTINLEKAKV